MRPRCRIWRVFTSGGSGTMAVDLGRILFIEKGGRVCPEDDNDDRWRVYIGLENYYDNSIVVYLDTEEYEEFLEEWYLFATDGQYVP